MITNYFFRNNRFYKKLIKNWYSKRNFLADINTYIDLLNYHFRDQDDDKNTTLIFGHMIMKNCILF